MKYLSIALLGLGLAACQPATRAESSGIAASPERDIESSIGDIAFAEAACAGCHAIRPLELSPSQHAPSFSDIANRRGLTDETLTTFLLDAHNYPEAMDFDLTPARVDALTAYILKLRDEAYRPQQ